MSAPPFTLLYTDEAQRVLLELDKPAHAVKLKKVKQALRCSATSGPATRA